jgi:hypothetical protein
MSGAVKRKTPRQLKAEFRQIQAFWSKKAKAKGILTERDLEKLLRNSRSS